MFQRKRELWSRTSEDIGDPIYGDAGQRRIEEASLGYVVIVRVVKVESRLCWRVRTMSSCECRGFGIDKLPGQIAPPDTKPIEIKDLNR